MELLGRVQKTDKTLQDFKAFSIGIRDVDVQHTVCAWRMSTFAETAAFALAQET